MKTTIITIGNSKGIRIPKILLQESGLKDAVEISLTKNGLVIAPIKTPKKESDEMLSNEALAKDWNKPEEDEAWANL